MWVQLPVGRSDMVGVITRLLSPDANLKNIKFKNKIKVRCYNSAYHIMITVCCNWLNALNISLKIPRRKESDIIKAHFFMCLCITASIMLTINYIKILIISWLTKIRLRFPLLTHHHQTPPDSAWPVSCWHCFHGYPSPSSF